MSFPQNYENFWWTIERWRPCGHRPKRPYGILDVLQVIHINVYSSNGLRLYASKRSAGSTQGSSVTLAAANLAGTSLTKIECSCAKMPKWQGIFHFFYMLNARFAYSSNHIIKIIAYYTMFFLRKTEILLILYNIQW